MQKRTYSEIQSHEELIPYPNGVVVRVTRKMDKIKENKNGQRRYAYREFFRVLKEGALNVDATNIAEVHQIVAKLNR